MALNVTALVNSPVQLDTDTLLLEEQKTLRTKYLGATINALGSYSTKTVALTKLHQQLESVNYPEKNELCLKLFVIVNKIFAKPEEPMLNRIYAGKCLVELIKESLTSTDTQREMGTNISGLLNVVNNLDCPDAWAPLLKQVMVSFPGGCGAFRGQILKKLSGEIGEGQIDGKTLGELFVLFQQVGGAGKDGIEHLKAFAMAFNKIVSTANTAINTIFQDVQLFEKLPSTTSDEELLPIQHRGMGSIANQYFKVSQAMDLLELECCMLTKSFNQPRKFDVDMLLRQISAVFSITSADILKNETPQNLLVNLLLPNIQVRAAQLLQALILSLEEDLIPEVATINNFFIKTLQTAKISKVVESLLKTLDVYVSILGPCTGLNFCMDRIMPVFAQHIIPQSEKLVLLGTQKKKRGKKKGSRHVIHDYKTATNTSQATVLSSQVVIAALNCLGTIVENIGCLLNNEDYLSISSLVVGAALKRQLEDGQAIVSLIGLICSLSRVSHHSFPTPLRLCLNFLQMSTQHPEQKVCLAARQALSVLSSSLHPACPTLAIPVLSKQDMDNIVRKMLRVEVDRKEDAENESDDEITMETNEDVRREPSPDSNTNTKTTPYKGEKIKETSDQVKIKESQAQQSGNQLKRKMAEPRPTNKDESSDDEVTSNELANNIKHIEDVKRKRKEIESVAETSKESAVKNAGDKEDDTNARETTKSKKSKSPVKEAKVSGGKFSSAESIQSMVPTVAASKEVINNAEGEEIDVQTMLNDFSDKLNENLLPDPFDGSDSDA